MIGRFVTLGEPIEAEPHYSCLAPGNINNIQADIPHLL